MICGVTAPIDDSWNRIEVWLAEHAPATFAGLEPPAAPETIAIAETAIGLPFPNALKQSLLRHNGTGYYDLLPALWRLLSAEDIADNWQLNTSIQIELASGGKGNSPLEADTLSWWHPQWIPFAADGGGDHLVIDQRSTPRQGRIGTASHETFGSFAQDAMRASLPALFQATAAALETGDVIYGRRRTVTGNGELEWAAPPREPRPDGGRRGRGRRAAD